MRSGIRKKWDNLNFRVESIYRKYEYRKKAKIRLKRMNGGYKCTKEYNEIVVPFWKKYGLRPDKMWYQIFWDRTHVPDPRYIPDDLWYGVIVPYFSNSQFRRFGVDLSNRNIGYGITGSFCTFAKTRKEIQRLTEMGAHVIPIFSYQTQNCDTRFGTAKEFMEEVCDITGNPGIRTLQEAEPIGPKGYLDVMVIAPCTGNSAAKLANAITDTPVLMAAKAHMRNGKPLVIAISTNDALGASFKNIGMLMNTKHIYFVPFAQDNYEKKPNSMVAKMELLPDIDY